MNQNALGQSDCRIFKSNISLKQNDEKVWFFACWYKFTEIKSWLKNIGVGMVTMGVPMKGKVIINSGKVIVTLIIGPPPYGGSYKITAVHLPIQHFTQEWLINFFIIWLVRFFALWEIIGIFKNWWSLFFQENLFLPRFGQKMFKMAPKWGSLDFLKDFAVSFSWK